MREDVTAEIDKRIVKLYRGDGEALPVVGAVLVFTGSFTSYATPQLLGGEQVMMMGTLMYQQAMVTFDWVIEDGLQICNKYSAIQRGSQVAQESTRTYVDRPISRQALEDILFKPEAVSTVATESRRGNLREIAREYLTISNSQGNVKVVGLGAGKW